jgi:hypothetical protein
LTDAIGQHIREAVHAYGQQPGLTRPQIVSDTLEEMQTRKIHPNQLRVIHGHGVFEGLHTVSLRQPRYFTFVRDAARRHMSLYNYFRLVAETPGHPLQSVYRGYVDNHGQPLDYPDWLETRPDFWNLMARTLYYASIDTIQEPFRPFPDTVEFHESHVAAVCRFLERMYFVGLVERAHVDLPHIAAALDLPGELPHLNESRSYFALHQNPSVVRRALELNWMDAAVHEHALSLRGQSSNTCFARRSA